MKHTTPWILACLLTGATVLIGATSAPVPAGAEETVKPYKLVVDYTAAPELAPVVEELKLVFADSYPKLVERFQSPKRPALMEIKLNFEKGLDHPAHASGDTLTFSVEWFQKNPKDLGVMTHELTHIVQAYRGRNPGWMVEGVADYSRAIYGPKNDGWKMPDPLVAGKHKYDQSYRVTARFLVWLEKAYPGTVDKANRRMQEGGFKVEEFETLTGKTIDALWQECLDSFK